MGSSSRQSGSIISFVVIGLVLIGLLLGGLYISKQRGRQIATNDQPVATQPVREGETQDEAPAENDGGTGTRETTVRPAPTPTPAPSPSRDAPAATTPPRATTPQTTPSTGPTQIAQTGPADFLVNGIVLFALTTATIGYVASRRDYIRSSLGSL